MSSTLFNSCLSDSFIMIICDKTYFDHMKIGERCAVCRPDRMCWIVCKFLCHILWVYLSYLPGWPSLVSSVITNDQSGFFSVHSSFNYCWDERCTVNTPHAASLAPASRFKIILISGFFTLCTFINTLSQYFNCVSIIYASITESLNHPSYW